MTTGVLPLDELKYLTHLNTGFFECSAYTEDAQMFVTSGNWDGAGMSAGNLQFNFGPANRLTELFQFMINNHESVCISAFGANTAEYNTWKTAMLGTQTDRQNFGESISTPKDGSGNDRRFLAEPYKTSLGNLLITAECKAKYYSMRDAYYWPSPFDLFRQMSCTSRLALASFFDVFVNKGRYYPVNLLQVDFDAIDANNAIDSVEKERQKIVQINHRANEEENALNDTSTTFFDDRRNAMRDQGGNYFGLNYDPDVQFDMNQEPAISEKTTTLGVKLGEINVDNVYFGTTPVTSVYLGANLLSGTPDPYTVATAPQTQFRTNPNNYAGIGAVSSISLASGQPMWVDVQNFVACRTYYTTDGSTPTTASTLYTQALSFTTSCTLKVLTVSIFGVAEAIKTLTVTVVAVPVTTISPSATVQNSIPITVTLTATNSPTAIYYKLGTTGTQQTYTAPFQVTQNSTGVMSTNIKVTYWAVNANGTEPEKSITYNTSGAIPAKPVVTVTNGNNSVTLNWAVTANTTSYSIYRSTASGTLGTVLSQYQAPNSYTDNTAVNGTTYYYTVRAGNYGTSTDSDQVVGLPVAPPTKPTYRYIKFEGYGTSTDDTTRGIELEVWSGGTNRVLNKTPLSSETVSTGTGTPSMMFNGTKTTTANSYPIWWSVTPNGRVVVDMGTQYAIDKIVYCSYSVSGTQRANQFKILGSNTNNGTDWASIWDMSATTDLQPILPAGYEITF